MDNVYRIWANRLEARTQAWQDCPEDFKSYVDAIMLADIANGKISQAKYDEIKGGLSEEEALNIILGGEEQ